MAGVATTSEATPPTALTTRAQGLQVRAQAASADELEGVEIFSSADRQHSNILQPGIAPQELLRAHQAPLPEKILNVYDIKTKPELTRYYHATVGFPTKLTWLAAIKNSHYTTLRGLDRSMAANYFPDSKEV